MGGPILRGYEIAACVTALVLGCLAARDARSSSPLVHRHAVALEVGVWSQTTEARVETLPAGVTTSVGGEGVLAGLSYRYWLEEVLALAISVRAHDLEIRKETDLTGTAARSAAVSSLLIGVRYYFPPSARGGAVRPCLGGDVGLFRGSQDEVITGAAVIVNSRTEQAFGGRLGLGVDFALGHHFLVGVGTGYDLMLDFGEPIAGSRNYSGPEFSFGFGYVFGREVADNQTRP
jgi:hypothetical protein